MIMDDMGAPVPLRRPPRRVVSLVPSLTEAIAVSAPGLLAGATEWCTHPPDLDVERVRGTKNPNVARIKELAPDLVVANKEENRELDVRRLREAGIPVWVTVVESVEQALSSLRRLFAVALDRPIPQWLESASDTLSRPVPNPHARAVICVWRDPWMVAGSRNFGTDLLRRLAIANVFHDLPGRYPALPLEDIRAAGADLIILPDEPYPFNTSDGPEQFGEKSRLVSGRLLTWYGPSLVDAVAMLREQLEPIPHEGRR
ncbi:helical backbone metal receptor [Actinomadura terrae]|uniref:helical backbone metal receptor n=1 Tax=Actinomadura terrae TaxID=604353 RepID=UPI001FA80FDE|nr:helical backbone metal receptor [Actinomadura terrae]